MMEAKNKIRANKGGREYRAAESFRALDQIEGSAEKIIEGHACTFNQPYELYRFKDWDDTEIVVYEQIDPHAFDQCDMNDVIMQYDHEGRVMARTRNQTLSVSTDNIGLFVHADLSKSTEGPGLYEDIRNGIIDRMSFGFVIDENNGDRIEEVKENGIDTITRTILRVKKLYDVSATSIPANDGTDISARSRCDGVIAEIRAERLRKQEKENRKQLDQIKLQLMKSLLQ